MCGGFLLRGALELFTDGGEAEAALLEDLGGEAFFFAEKAEEKVLGANVFVREALGFFSGVGEDSLALVGEWEVD